MAGKTAITAEYVRARLDYDPETGTFTWKPKSGGDLQTNAWNAHWAGKVAGTPHKRGYIVITLDERKWLAHRLAWLYVFGEWPAGGLDHKDKDTSNNAIANLRPASQSQNNWNTSKRRNNSSGFKGVTWHAARQKWTAWVCVNRKSKYLGLFNTPEEAAAAYAEAARKLHGEFARIE